MTTSEDVEMSDGPSLTNGTIVPPEKGIVEHGFLDIVDALSDTDSQPEVIAEKRNGSLLPTGCCFDERMRLHANADFASYPPHPEDPRRITSIMKALRDGELVYYGNETDLADILHKSPARFMYRIAAREAMDEEICTVHTERLLSWVQSLKNLSSRELRDLSHELENGRTSLYIGNMSVEAALLSAGGAIETCKHVVNGSVKNAIAVIRPPGHHAEADESLGFCFFNNVPIAARVCQQDYPDLCRKVFILDWDVHHGNGIQNIFYDDPNVLYISLHVWMNGAFYPGTPVDEKLADGSHTSIGAGAGVGKNINIPWKSQGMGDAEYLAAFQRVVMPIAQEFDPDLVIVSAGFDAAEGDELGGCHVSPACYAHMTHMLMSLAAGKVAVCLEGGYNLKAISRSALAVAQTLMGEPPPRVNPPIVKAEAIRVIHKVRETQAPYWECMRSSKVISPVQLQLPEQNKRLDSIVRLAQHKILRDNYMMLPLFVLREKLAKAFESQVLFTRHLQSAKKILVIIHDPPEIIADIDPVDGSLSSAEAYARDAVVPYIDWAVSQDIGVLDINVPRDLVEDSDDEQDPDVKSDRQRLQMKEKMRELVCYLWDNYLESYEADHIVLVGVGEAVGAVKELLISRGSCSHFVSLSYSTVIMMKDRLTCTVFPYKDAKSRISGIVCFVSSTSALSPVTSQADEYLADWYKNHSRVYIASDHICWQDAALTKKVRKRRFGTVMRSSEIGLLNMMSTHMHEAIEYINESMQSLEEQSSGGEYA